jgi:hypothetical protein
MKKMSTYLAAGLIFGAVGFLSFGGNYYLESKRSEDINSFYTKEDTTYLTFLKNNYFKNDGSIDDMTASCQIPFEKATETFFNKITVGDTLTTSVQNEFVKIRKAFPEYTEQNHEALKAKVELNSMYNDELKTLKASSALFLILTFISINMHGSEIRRKEMYGSSNDYSKFI